jgi:hypothetical protein
MGTPSVIGSPGSESGPTPCDSPVGPMTDLFGQPLSHASPSAQPGKDSVLKTSATSLKCGFGSPQSADLQSRLANRLSQRLASGGSTLFSYALSKPTTPAGRQYFLLRASARRTSGQGFTGWPTPDAGAMNLNDSNWEARRAECKERHCNNGFGLTLGMASQLASWPTPTVDDSGNVTRDSGQFQSLTRTSALASWATPNCMDHLTSGNLEARKTKGGCVNLKDHAPLTVSGPTQSGSLAATEKPGQLNPAFSRWLMGLPPEWDDCAVTAMQSLPRKRRNS